MPRLARAVAPGLPHHVTQRGNRCQKTFLCTDDCLLYLALMAEECDRFSVDIWAYCLMPNHSQLIAVPPTPEALRKAVGEAHRRYTLEVNEREGWRGHLWQGRFSSFVMDERYLLNAARYIELNPVRAGLVQHPGDYVWSSARAHLIGRDDGLVRVAPLLERAGDWRKFLNEPGNTEDFDAIRRHANTGRPLGTDAFVESVESALGRMLRPLKPGRKPEATA
jgi:putative transposase